MQCTQNPHWCNKHKVHTNFSSLYSLLQAKQPRDLQRSTHDIKLLNETQLRCSEFSFSLVTLKSVFNINRFKQNITTSGYVAKDGNAYCISPLLYETGFIPFEVSTDDGLTFPYSGTWLSGYLNLQYPFSFCVHAHAYKII